MSVTLLVLSVGMIPEVWKARPDVLRCRTDGYGAQPLKFSRNFRRVVSRDAAQAVFEQLYMWNVLLLDICGHFLVGSALCTACEDEDRCKVCNV